MEKTWVDVRLLKERLKQFFASETKELSRFGRTVNQTFEAFVLAQVVGWYRTRGWTTTLTNPAPSGGGKPVFRLKFSTRGRPGNYSYFRCTKDGAEIEVRHQLRVATAHHQLDQKPAANVCLDVAIVSPDPQIGSYSSYDFLENPRLFSFGEAKHMSAFAELVAGFIGLVHELQPKRLRRTRRRNSPDREHPSPFLYVSGNLWATAEGLNRTIKKRRYDINVFCRTSHLAVAIQLPTKAAPAKPKAKRPR